MLLLLLYVYFILIKKSLKIKNFPRHNSVQIKALVVVDVVEEAEAMAARNAA